LNLGPVLRFLGRLLVLLSVAEALPALCCLIYGERGDAGAFLLTSGLTLLCGLLLTRFGSQGEGLYRREGILIVVGGWVLASAFGALPYLLTGTFHSPIDALFESASGFTTTGASVLTDIEVAGYGVRFWRSFTQWLGGMGIIVLFVALLPEIVPGARFLFKMEVPGPTSETLHPRVRDTAIVLWRIYLLFTVLQTALLMAFGMGLYDALDPVHRGILTPQRLDGRVWSRASTRRDRLHVAVGSELLAVLSGLAGAKGRASTRS
jgi:trk system potassium uptake protein TrkH